MFTTPVARAAGQPLRKLNIAKVLSKNSKKIDNKTVTNFTGTLVEAYLFYKVNRYDIKGKQHLATLEKYYLADLGFRNALLGKELVSDAGHLLENLTYLELKRRNNQVWLGKTNASEVDFVVRNNEGFTKLYTSRANSSKHNDFRT